MDMYTCIYMYMKIRCVEQTKQMYMYIYTQVLWKVLHVLGQLSWQNLTVSTYINSCYMYIYMYVGTCLFIHTVVFRSEVSRSSPAVLWITPPPLPPLGKDSYSWLGQGAPVPRNWNSDVCMTQHNYTYNVYIHMCTCTVHVQYIERPFRHTHYHYLSISRSSCLADLGLWFLRRFFLRGLLITTSSCSI